MNRVLLGLALAVLLILSFVLYRASTAGEQLNVEPHAAEEIEKAKER